MSKSGEHIPALILMRPYLLSPAARTGARSRRGCYLVRQPGASRAPYQCFRMAPTTKAVTPPAQLRAFPQLRFMGSKVRLLPWIHEVLGEISFDSALDAFSGSGSVGYLLKSMGKQVVSNDRLSFSAAIATALIENPGVRLDDDAVDALLQPNLSADDFIQRTFTGIFFTPDDLAFLDLAWSNLAALENPYQYAIAISALVRSCAKRQPRGVFTVAGDPEHYKDGRRDLRLTLREHFVEHVAAYNRAAFDNGRINRALHGDVFTADVGPVDLVYLDPPYVPRADDNCYVKRYHFLEGLSTYWRGAELVERSRVKKLKKPYTPFSYRKDALDAFDRLFARFAESTIVLSYSSNGFPDLSTLVQLMGRYKREVVVHGREHRYHFGTHGKAERNEVTEYLIVGT
jgi:adenine-specific DNA-methyltransferase